MGITAKFKEKNKAKVKFESRLQLKTLSGTATYELYAIARHLTGGKSTESGHYNAFVKSVHNGKWDEANDQDVKSLSESEVFCDHSFEKAYLLFYKKVGA